MIQKRREFVRSLLGAGAGLPLAARGLPVGTVQTSRASRESSLLAALRAGDSSSLDLSPRSARLVRAQATPARPLAERFDDLPRHFVFEYYPWYRCDPWSHWSQWDRLPPEDIAACYLPRLGPYDSRSRTVIEQHARWIAESGAGAINVSWWGRGSPEDRTLPLILDVMRDHGIKVAFHLEPYAADHGARWQEDILYLLREYGERRRFDALLVLRDEDGSEGPVFKGFRSIVPPETKDCRGQTQPVADHTPDDVYARQFDALRKTLHGAFDHVTLLADSLDFVRAPRAGFDGVAIYDNFVPPAWYRPAAERASSVSLLFSFNVNPGYDTVEPRVPETCYSSLPFAPPTDPIDWTDVEERERAAALSVSRIDESWRETLAVQSDPALADARGGFFLTYLNSFNEWHEGHAFEPMRDAAEIPPAERGQGYHNPTRGDYRLTRLRSLLAPVLAAPSAAGRAE